jgi:hypothetical protein
MFKKKNTIAALVFLSLVFTFSVSANTKKPGEYKSIVSHLKTKYKAKKVKIPFIWLARFAVSVVRPAGIKSFSVTMFEDLKFSGETLDAEMQTAMRNSFDANWSPILRVRSRTGEQVYMYMREAGNVVKIAVVTIDKAQASVIRATFNPDKLAEFVNDPKIFGISLDDNKQTAKIISDNSSEKSSVENKSPETKSEN